MSRDNIIRMAEKSGMTVQIEPAPFSPVPIVRYGGGGPRNIAELEHFAQLVIEDFCIRSGKYLTNDASREACIADAVAEEREECARLCAEMGHDANGYGCAADIRARGAAPYQRPKPLCEQESPSVGAPDQQTATLFHPDTTTKPTP